jgi:antitoxin YefM
MDAISYTSARANFAAAMERVCADHDPIIITRAKAPSVVMLSMEDYRSLEETAYLLRSPTNARRLFAAVDQLEGSQGTVRELPE